MEKPKRAVRSKGEAARGAFVLAQRAANMSWSRVKVSDVGVAEGPPERSRPASATSTCAVVIPTSKAKAAVRPPPSPKASAGGSAGASSGACEFALELPVLVNTRTVLDGQELLVFRPPVQPVKRRQPAPVRLVKIMKAK